MPLGWNRNGPASARSADRADGRRRARPAWLQPLLDDRGNPLARAAVTERKRRGGARAMQALLHRGQDDAGIGADQLKTAAGDGFGPLGLFAKDEQRHSERGRLFLHSAGIAQDQVRSKHSRDRVAVAARRPKRDSRLPEQKSAKPVRKRRIWVQNDFHLGDVLSGDRSNRGGDTDDPVAPVFPPVTGDQEAGRPIMWRGRRRVQPENRVDPGIAGHMDRPAHPLPAQVRGAQLGGREQQLRIGVDRYPKFLFGPGKATIVASKPCLHMGEANAGKGSCKRSSERARRVALDDHQFGTDSGKDRGNGPGDGFDVQVRIVATATVEADVGIRIEPVVGRPRQRVLPGEDQQRRESAFGQCRRDRGELDGFGPGADDKNNGIGQSSP